MICIYQIKTIKWDEIHLTCNVFKPFGLSKTPPAPRFLKYTKGVVWGLWWTVGTCGCAVSLPLDWRYVHRQALHHLKWLFRCRQRLMSTDRSSWVHRRADGQQPDTDSLGTRNEQKNGRMRGVGVWIWTILTYSKTSTVNWKDKEDEDGQTNSSLLCSAQHSYWFFFFFWMNLSFFTVSAWNQQSREETEDQKHH